MQTQPNPEAEPANGTPPSSENRQSEIENRKFKFAIPVRELKEAVGELRKIAKSNSSLPILGTVLIERKLGSTRLTATNLDLHLTYAIPFHLPQPSSDLGKQLLAKRSEREDGAVCVPIKDLTTTVKSADAAGEITFTATALHYKFGGNTAALNLEVIEASEFPPPPKATFSQPGSIFPEKAKQAMIACLPNATDDDARYILLSVFLDAANSAIVATDGKALTCYDLKGQSGSNLPPIGQLIIPKDAVRVLAGKMSKLPWAIAGATEHFSTGGQSAVVKFVAGNWTLRSKLIEGTYPNWQQVIPAADKSQISIPLTVFSRSEIAGLLKRLPKAPQSENDPVCLGVHGSELKFSVGDSAFTINVPGNHPLRHVAANRKFWQRAVDLGVTELRVQDEKSPVVARNRNGMTFVFMPVRMS